MFQLIALLLLHGMPNQRVAEPTSPKLEADPTTLTKLVNELEHPRYAIREAASERLRAAGTPAIKFLLKAATDGSLEATDRAVNILRDQALTGDAATSQAALAALNKLAGSSRSEAASRAKDALALHVGRIVAELERVGAQVEFENGSVVTVSFHAAKQIGDQLRLLQHFPELRGLYLNSRLVDDAVLANLPALPKLTRLDLFQSGIGDESLKLLKQFPRLETVPMGQTKVTDAGLAHLRDMNTLIYVGLRGNNVTDAGVAHLGGIKNLQGLNLAETKVTDAGLVHLKGLQRLDYLHLNNTAVTDAGLEQLIAVPKLRLLYLWDTRATPVGVAKLKAAAPALQIVTRHE